MLVEKSPKILNEGFGYPDILSYSSFRNIKAIFPPSRTIIWEEKSRMVPLNVRMYHMVLYLNRI